jgi:[1-hydroxy-2-(trimethylamino)ethyl]phosphonate dioxygenase
MTDTIRTPVIDTIRDIFERHGADSYLGEAVTMSAHMLQAAQLAEREGADEALIAAALLHDIGHYAGDFPEDYIEQGIDNRHQLAGARVLAPFFPPEVVEAVGLHVDAKRYLCAIDPCYHDRLSDASVQTLILQGGPMNPDEVVEFERHPHHQAAVRVRRWDDAAKVPDTVTPTLAHYLPLLERLLVR